MRFIDEMVIRIAAGSGGNGSVSFHRTRYLPKGGPDGGDGGHGGSVILRASAQLSTLQDTTLKSKIQAQNGAPGLGGKKHGKAGKDTILLVPVGTMVWDLDGEEERFLADLSETGAEFVIAKGGRGGYGNTRFATPTNRAPRKAIPGKPGEQRTVRLELKLLADVGLVGRPNAGKSTLLAKLTRAKPHIGDYPFSTLSPALGVVPYGFYQRFVLADLPGLAEGARDGRGLGHQFLRHIERTRLLVIMIEATESDYRKAYDQLIEELEGYGSALTSLPRLIIMSKSDLNGEEQGTVDFPFDLKVSSVTGEGLEQLVELMAGRLGMVRERLGTGETG